VDGKHNMEDLGPDMAASPRLSVTDGASIWMEITRGRSA